MKWQKMVFFYKKCEVCGNKINKMTESSNSEGKLKLICKKCGSEYVNPHKNEKKVFT